MWRSTTALQEIIPYQVIGMAMAQPQSVSIVTALSTCATPTPSASRTLSSLLARRDINRSPGIGMETEWIQSASTVMDNLLCNSNSAGAATMSFFLGNPGDIGIAGDWNGDGMDTTGVLPPR